MARHETVEAVSDESGQQTTDAAQKPPRLFEVVADGDDRLGLSTETAIHRKDDAVGQRLCLGEMPEFERFTLQRSEVERVVALVPNDKLHGAVAEVADTVEKDYRCGVRRIF